MFCLFYYCLKLMWVEREFWNNVSKHICLSYDSNICTSVISVVHSIQQCHSQLWVFDFLFWFCQCQIMSVCFTFSWWSNRCGSMFVMCALFICLLKIQRQLRVNVLTEIRAKHLVDCDLLPSFLKEVKSFSVTLADYVITNALLFDWLMRFLGV